MSSSATQSKTHRLPESGEVVNGRYRLVGKIASGGMGVVMRATDLAMEREVGIKLLHGHIASQEGFTERFKQEVRVATLFNHPNITRVYDFGETDEGLLYLVMELLDGEELKDVIRRQGPMAAGRTLDIGLQVLDGLAEAHSMEIIHRDLKPSNIFLSLTRRGKEVVKLLDFGVAKLLDSTESTLTKTGMVAGTPSYMAPERIMGGGDSYAVDVYAVGLILLEMLMGKKVFKGETMAQSLLMHLKKPVPLPKPIAEAALGEVIRKATLKHPKDRFRDAEQMLQALSRAADQTPRDLVLSPSDAPPEPDDTSSSILDQIARGEGKVSLLRRMPQHESDFRAHAREAASADEFLNTILLDEDDLETLGANEFEIGETEVYEPRSSASTIVARGSAGSDKPTPGPAGLGNDDTDPIVDDHGAQDTRPATALIDKQRAAPAEPAQEPAPLPRSADQMLRSVLRDQRRLYWAAGAVAVILVVVTMFAVTTGQETQGPDDDQPSAASAQQEPSALELYPEFAGADDESITLVINSEPTGAHVYDGSELLGVTELALTISDQQRPAQLRLEKSGYETESVEIPEDSDAPLMIELRAEQPSDDDAETARSQTRTPKRRIKPRPQRTPSSTRRTTTTDKKPAAQQPPDEDDNASEDVDNVLDKYLPKP